MHPGRFLQLGLLAFGLAIGSFVVLGTSRLVVSVELARMLAAPLFIGGFLVAVFAFVLAVLAKLGLIGLDDPA